MAGADVSIESDSADGVDGEEKVRLEDRGKASGNEPADGEGDESVGEHVRGLC